MPEMSPLGWFHTAMGIIALVSGGMALIKFKEITLQSRSGQTYLASTLVTAVTALAIFKHGGFGPAHALAVMTLLALAVGMLASLTGLFGKFSRYVRAIGFTSTLLFHSIPAITDALLRLPVDDPFLASFEDPIMQKAHLAVVVIFLVGLAVQLRWIHQQRD
ncbi:MAG: hypothetical protein K0U72_12275 [Gammaproteobacteria bacterium]|nr:hypothetical protein [Gammaproteobacteria bacterium]